MTSTASFYKKILILMVWSSLTPKWPIPVPFCGINHQKSSFLLISDTFSVRGCWGQPMSFFSKLDDETQKCNPPEATRHHNSRKYLSLYPSEPFRILRFNMRHPVYVYMYMFQGVIRLPFCLSLCLLHWRFLRSCWF